MNPYDRGSAFGEFFCFSLLNICLVKKNKLEESMPEIFFLKQFGSFFY